MAGPLPSTAVSDFAPRAKRRARINGPPGRRIRSARAGGRSPGGFLASLRTKLTTATTASRPAARTGDSGLTSLGRRWVQHVSGLISHGHGDTLRSRTCRRSAQRGAATGGVRWRERETDAYLPDSPDHQAGQPAPAAERAHPRRAARARRRPGLPQARGAGVLWPGGSPSLGRRSGALVDRRTIVNHELRGLLAPASVTGESESLAIGGA